MNSSRIIIYYTYKNYIIAQSQLCEIISILPFTYICISSIILSQVNLQDQ